MPTGSPIVDLAHAIQLAVAPVFLLTGVGAILNVLTNRLARIVDRTRVLEEGDGPVRDAYATAAELVVLRRRGTLINSAIRFCTFSALLVSGVVAAIFLGTFVRIDFSLIVAATFVLAMLSLMAGLVSFLREVQAAIRFVRSHVGSRERPGR
ncbi:MAG: DUF2721 domain-containing protein [Planctomycetota bacterium]|nr:DUF2721 domain-containing protein [Planctomycetaceae bacterium]MDQ3330117.1 DUF2721 domain-containing protein [Planctomycetota bacterium]